MTSTKLFFAFLIASVMVEKIIKIGYNTKKALNCKADMDIEKIQEVEKDNNPSEWSKLATEVRNDVASGYKWQLDTAMQWKPFTTDAFAEALESKNPYNQLSAINNLECLMRANTIPEIELNSILQTLKNSELKKSNPPLIKLASLFLSKKLKEDYGRLEPNEKPLRPDNFFFEDIQNQEGLAREYPHLTSFPNLLIKIAPDVIGSYDEYQNLREVGFREGSQNNCDFEEYSLGQDPEDETRQLIPFAHNILFKPLINKSIGCNLSDISFNSQVQLLKFMTESDNTRFNTLCATLNNIDESLRKKLLENFVAADFGMDFGDSLLEIANSSRFSDEQVGEILDSIEKCRKSIRDITDFYQNLDDGSFAKQYARAANERLTDALKVFEKIAETGEAQANLDWLGESGFDYITAIEALKHEKKSLEIIAGVFGDISDKKDGTFAETVLNPSFRQERTLYNIYSPNHGYVLLYTRPEGSSIFDPAIEYGNRNGVEASISLIVNPVEPFELPNPFKSTKFLSKSGDIKLNKVSAIRLDREGRTADMAANSPERTPVNQDGIISVDLAAVGDGADTPSGKIARLISVGNKLRAEAKGKSPTLNHNMAWFNQKKYGTSDGFKRIVEYVDTEMQKLCRNNPPMRESESFAKKTREAKRRLGRKVRAI